MELADQLDEVVAAESLTTLLLTLVFIHLIDGYFVFSVLGLTVLHKDVELYEL